MENHCIPGLHHLEQSCPEPAGPLLRLASLTQTQKMGVHVGTIIWSKECVIL